MPLDQDQKQTSAFAKLAAVCGIAAFVLSVLGTFILGFFKTGYDPIRSTISELGERGGQNYLIAGIVFMIIGAAEVVFSLGLYRRFKKYKIALVGTILLIINGVFDYVGSALFPCDPGGAYESAFGQIHFAASVIGMAVMVLPAFFYWRVFAAEPRTGDRRLTLVAAVVIAVGGLVFNICFFTDMFVGLAQRILDLAYFGWILILSIRMLAKEKA